MTSSVRRVRNETNEKITENRRAANGDENCVVVVATYLLVHQLFSLTENSARNFRDWRLETVVGKLGRRDGRRFSRENSPVK